MKIAKGEINKTNITPVLVEKYLGPPQFTEEDAQHMMKEERWLSLDKLEALPYTNQ